VTQTPNALHTSLSGGTESSAKEASMRKQDDRQDTGVRHVGIHATNPTASSEFYRDVLGMEITGGSAPFQACVLEKNIPNQVRIQSPPVLRLLFRRP
jgi:hypothetical protein